MKRRLIALALAATLGASPNLLAQDSPAAISTEVRTLISKGELDEAIAKIDELAKVETGAAMAATLRSSVSMSLLQKDRKKEAVEQITKAIDYQLANLDKPSSASLASTLSFMNSVLPRAGEAKRADELNELIFKSVKEKLPESEFSPLHQTFSTILRAKAGRLMAQGAKAEGLALLESDVAMAEKILAANPDKPQATAYAISAMGGLIPMLDGAEAVKALLSRIDKLASSQLKAKPDLAILSSYMSTVGGYISRASREDPVSAEVAVKNVRELFESGKTLLPDSEKQIEAMLKSLDRYDSQIAAGKKLVEMIGKPAPRFDIMQIVNGKSFTQEELKGKVVLLDFWAVWCGPCIATFPHLRHLTEEYGPKGLQIVGVTRQYNYNWDEETKKAKGAPKGETVSLDEELVMLEKFLASYELKHSTIVTPAESTMNKEYAVTGIPHVALLDKSGAVRLIKIGSGEKNSKDIEEMIQKLLSE